MKFKAKIKTTNSAGWWEEFEESDVDTIAKICDFASNLCSRFNLGLRTGEMARFFTGRVRILIGEARRRHKWEKTNLVTKMGRNGLGAHDEMKCSVCGRKCLRVGLNRMTRDPKDKKPLDLEFC